MSAVTLLITAPLVHLQSNKAIQFIQICRAKTELKPSECYCFTVFLFSGTLQLHCKFRCCHKMSSVCHLSVTRVYHYDETVNISL